MKKLSIVAMLILTLAFSNQVNAETQSSPYQLIKSLTEQVFEQVSQAKAEQPNSVNSIEDIINNTLMPHVDVAFASYKILGAQLRKTTKEERAAFVDAMRTDLIKTYSSALAQYNNQKVVYESEKPTTDKTLVAIRAELIAQSQPSVDMVFKLRKNKNTGEWKAYDLVVEGISLVDSKRAELSRPLRSLGIEHVTAQLLE